MTLPSNLLAKFHVLYVTFRSNPDNDELTDGMWCGQQGQPPTLVKELRMAYPKLDFEILEARRSEYAKLLAKVDKALFDKAIEGDAKAADTIYRRFENWSPKNAETPGKAGIKTFADLIQEE
mgnify:CR=1 FL=1